MANLRDIRNRIASINNTEQITKAMKMVAAAKLRKAQGRMISSRPFTSKLQEVVGRLVESYDGFQPVMRVSTSVSKVLYIVVGADRGLCGGFNNNLFKEVEHHINSNFSDQAENGNLSLIAIGKKATAHFGKRKYNVIKSFPGFFDNISYDVTSKIMTDVVSKFSDSEFDEVYIAYNEFKSVIAQSRKVEKILPIDPKLLLDESSDDASNLTIDYLYEPNSEEILNKLFPLYLNMELWKAILESNASEQGARMSAMDSATENAKELNRVLRLKYNQARQSAITTEISEIVSGAQALSGG